MALWQFEVVLVPCELVGNSTSVSAGALHDDDWWRHRQPPSDYAAVFSSFLPMAASTPEFPRWGDDSSDCIHVWQYQGRVVSVTGRIDCAAMNLEFIKFLYDTARRWDCELVYTRNGTVMPHDFDNLLCYAMSSWNR